MKDAKGRELYNIKYARQIAEELVEILTPVTEKIEIVGSIRRKHRLVKDAKILFVPKVQDSHADFFAPTPIDMANRKLNELLLAGKIDQRYNSDGSPTWGKLNKLARYRDLPVDLFATTQANWFVSLVIRTGPKALNIMLAKAAEEKGLKLHAYGVFSKPDGTGEIVPKSEREVFKIAGLKYCEPEDRE